MPLANPVNRPGSVLRDERLRIRGGTFQRWEVFWRADISQSDADIAQKTTALDPLDRRIAE